MPVRIALSAAALIASSSNAWLLCMACEELSDKEGHLTLQQVDTVTVTVTNASATLVITGIGISTSRHH